MDSLLIWESFSFAVNLFGVLVFGAMSWLYFDAVAVRKQLNIWLSAVGSLALSLSFVFSISNFDEVSIVLTILGFLLVGLGAWTKPMSKRPTLETSHALVAFTGYAENIFGLLSVLAPAFAGLGYFRLASVGMERHLRRLGFGMYVFAISNLFAIRRLFDEWSDPRIVNLIGDYQVFWILEKVLLFVGLLLVSGWVFSYLLKRFETQIALSLGVIVILVFGTSVVLYSYVIAYGYQSLILSQSGNTVRLVGQIMQERSLSMLGQASVLAKSSNQMEMLAGAGAEKAKLEIEDLVKQTDLTRVWVADTGLQSLLTWGGEMEKVSNDWSVVNKMIENGSAYGFVNINDEVYLMAGSTIFSLEKKVGYVLLARKVDSTLLASMNLSGISISLWSQSVLKAKSGVKVDIRIGTKDSSGYYEELKEARTTREKANLTIGGKQYMVSGEAIYDPRGSVVGTLVAGNTVFEAWEQILTELRISYRWAMGLLLVMFLPAYLIAKKLRAQID